VSDLFHGRPLLVLFSVAAAGFLLGKVTVLRFSLGVAAVLFCGLGAGALIPGVELPELVPQLGLTLFVYTLGLASGPSFFASLRLQGLKDNGLALAVVATCFLATWALAGSLGLGGPTAVGVFTGALTNTPALASVVDVLRRGATDPATIAAPVIAYSVCYPTGVLAPLLAVWLADRVFGVRYQNEPVSPGYDSLGNEPLVNATVAVAGDQARSLRQLRAEHRHVVFGRVRRGQRSTIAHDQTVLAAGDQVTVIGPESEVARATSALGQRSGTRIDLDRSQVDYRRMFISDPLVVGRPLRELGLAEKYDAVITRVRRGDVDLLPEDDFELQLGDRARVLAPVERLPELKQLLGDSMRHVSEVDLITFSLGIALGLLLGSVPFPLPGGRTFELGLAGGPLLVGLVLGRLGRTGPLVWMSPLGANLTLRQLGLVLFLAGVGVRSGGAFASNMHATELLPLFASGAAVTLTSVTLALIVGHKLLRIPLTVLIGTVSGIHTQPAVLAFAVDKAHSDLPNIGYTTVYPLSTIVKIILAQALLQVLGS
jgi:putative transport protein